MFRTTFNENEKLWSGVAKPKLDHTNTSVGAALLNAMKRHPNKIAQISANNNVQCTHEEIYTKTVRAAQNIQKLEHKDGDIFAIMSNNNHNLAPIAFALFSLGYPFQTLDPSFTEAETAHLFSLTMPTVVFSDVKSYNVVEKSLRSLKNDAKIYTFGEQIGQSQMVEDLFSETGCEEEFNAIEVDDKQKTALILCSSGTTGLPKAICITHELILNELPGLQIEALDEVNLCFSTLYWFSGILSLLLGTLQSATRVITTETFTPELMLQLIAKYKVTSVFSVSYQMALTLKCSAIETTDLTSVKRFIGGGSKISLETSKALQKYIPNGLVLIGYGMSELFGGIAINVNGAASDAVGQLAGGARVKIVDDDGNRLGIDQEGEVCVQKDYKFGGYYGDQEATDALYDSEGFLKTGDIGRFDQNGLLYLVDRKKDIWKYRNYMISPSDIEQFLLGCPGIRAVCVVGITDFISGDLPAAVVVRQENSTITEQEISDLVANKFADSKKLRGGVYFVDSLPVTPSGKLIRREIRLRATKMYEATIQQKSNC